MSKKRKSKYNYNNFIKNLFSKIIYFNFVKKIQKSKIKKISNTYTMNNVDKIAEII